MLSFVDLLVRFHFLSFYVLKQSFCSGKDWRGTVQTQKEIDRTRGNIGKERQRKSESNKVKKDSPITIEINATNSIRSLAAFGDNNGCKKRQRAK